MSEKIIKTADLKKLIDGLKAKEYKVVAPTKVKDMVLYQEVDSFDEVTFDYINPKSSIKEWLFPRTEKILKYKLTQKDVELEELNGTASKTAIFGARPCDAASLPIMDEVFKWDYEDDFYLAKRAATAVISIACKACDESCFCTSVGLAPNSREGSDIMLSSISEDEYVADVVTEKGEEIVAELGDIFTDAAAEQVEQAKQDVAEVTPRFDVEQVKGWLDANFENEIFPEFSHKCLGCGCCTFVCPTCHCFDIVDESTLTEGARIKNWDSCQFGLFTLHASGHNPRATQSARWRQRLMHKFKYYVDKFGKRSCVGCGRCIRWCPVNMNIADQLAELSGKKE